MTVTVIRTSLGLFAWQQHYLSLFRLYWGLLCLRRASQKSKAVLAGLTVRLGWGSDRLAAWSARAAGAGRVRSVGGSEKDRAWQGSTSMTGLTARVRRVPGGAKGFPAAKEGFSSTSESQRTDAWHACTLQLQWRTQVSASFHDRAPRTYDSTHTGLKPQEESLMTIPGPFTACKPRFLATQSAWSR